MLGVFDLVLSCSVHRVCSWGVRLRIESARYHKDKGPVVINHRLAPHPRARREVQVLSPSLPEGIPAPSVHLGQFPALRRSCIRDAHHVPAQPSGGEGREPRVRTGWVTQAPRKRCSCPSQRPGWGRQEPQGRAPHAALSSRPDSPEGPLHPAVKMECSKSPPHSATAQQPPATHGYRSRKI